MNYEFIKDMLPAIAGLTGTVIGFCGAIYSSVIHNDLGIK